MLNSFDSQNIHVWTNKQWKKQLKATTMYWMDMDSVPAEYGPNQTKLNEKSSETKLWYSIMISSLNHFLSWRKKMALRLFHWLPLTSCEFWYIRYFEMKIFGEEGNSFSFSFVFGQNVQNRNCVNVDIWTGRPFENSHIITFRGRLMDIGSQTIGISIWNQSIFWDWKKKKKNHSNEAKKCSLSKIIKARHRNYLLMPNEYVCDWSKLIKLSLLFIDHVIISKRCTFSHFSRVHLENNRL